VLTPVTLSLHPDAAVIFQDFRVHVEQELGIGGEFEWIADWGGKYPGMVARIAAVLHAIKQVDRQWRETSVSADTMQAAITIGRYLARHPLVAFASMGAHPTQETAVHALRWLGHAEASESSLRDVHKALKGRFPDVADIAKGLDLLVEHGYIRGVAVPRKAGGGESRVPVMWSTPNFVLSILRIDPTR
jgi:replicative DNA helicase